MAGRTNFFFAILVGVTFVVTNAKSPPLETESTVSPLVTDASNIEDRLRMNELDLEHQIADHWLINTIANKSVATKPALAKHLNDFKSYINMLVEVQKHLKQILHSGDLKEINAYAEWFVSTAPFSPQDLLKRIQDLFIQKHGVFHLLKEFLDEDMVCELQKSQWQVMYELYYTVRLTKIRIYAMLEFCWNFRAKGNFHNDLNSAKLEHVHSLQELALSFTKQDASTVLHRCDPSSVVDGYAEVTNFRQAYILNEYYMTKKTNCVGQCSDYQSTRMKKLCTDDRDPFCRNSPKCYSNITECQVIDGSMEMWVSHAHNRRYNYISFNNGRHWGQSKDNTLYILEGSGWQIWKAPFGYCSNCLCLCNEQNVYSPGHHFSLRPTVSDIQNNKVITGVQLVKKDGIFYLQIHEGTLKERGIVTGTTVQDIEKLHLYDCIKGVDYHELTNEMRNVLMEGVHAPPGWVLTGVKFELAGNLLVMRIRYTLFSYTTGKLYANESAWSNIGHSANYISVETRDVPSRHYGHRIYEGSNDKDWYLDFDHTDLETDIGQTVVPFLDTQPVISRAGPNTINKNLLSGAGLFYWKKTGSGGYISVKVFTYPYLNESTEQNLDVIHFIKEDSNIHFQDPFTKSMHNGLSTNDKYSTENEDDKYKTTMADSTFVTETKSAVYKIITDADYSTVPKTRFTPKTKGVGYDSKYTDDTDISRDHRFTSQQEYESTTTPLDSSITTTTGNDGYSFKSTYAHYTDSSGTYKYVPLRKDNKYTVALENNIFGISTVDDNYTTETTNTEIKVHDNTKQAVVGIWNVTRDSSFATKAEDGRRTTDSKKGGISTQPEEYITRQNKYEEGTTHANTMDIKPSRRNGDLNPTPKKKKT